MRIMGCLHSVECVESGERPIKNFCPEVLSSPFFEDSPYCSWEGVFYHARETIHVDGIEFMLHSLCGLFERFDREHRRKEVFGMPPRGGSTSTEETAHGDDMIGLFCPTGERKAHEEVSVPMVRKQVVYGLLDKPPFQILILAERNMF
jgi:hypothetical protein